MKILAWLILIIICGGTYILGFWLIPIWFAKTPPNTPWYYGVVFNHFLVFLFIVLYIILKWSFFTVGII